MIAAACARASRRSASTAARSPSRRARRAPAARSAARTEPQSQRREPGERSRALAYLLPMPTPWARCSDLPSVCRPGGDHDLGLLELLDRLVAGGRHRRAERTEEVEAAVVLVRRARRGSPRSVARAACTRTAGAWDGTSPCPSGTPAGCLVRRRAANRSSPRRRRRDRLGDVATGAHATVGDDVHVHAGLVEVTDPRARGVGDRGGLRHTDAEHSAGHCHA